MKISISSPQIEEPENGQDQFELDTANQNKEVADFYTLHGRDTTLLGHDAKVIEERIGKIGTIVIIKNNHVVYLQKYQVDTFGQKKMITQLMVWSSKEMQGFARSVMLSNLDHYDMIATSGIQRPLGVSMWKKFVLSNIQKLQIYVFELGHLIPIDRPEQFVEMYPRIWGHSYKYNFVKIVVSKSPIDSTLFE